MMNTRHINFLKIAAIGLLFSLQGCRPSEINNAPEYYAYLADPENGLVKEKTVAGVHYRLKYLPKDYLAYNMVGKNGVVSQGMRDSIAGQFDHSLTFLLNIGPAEGEHFDVTRLDVNDYGTFIDRIEKLCFHLQESIRLNVDGEEQAPVIARMENINAQEPGRNFVIVFNTQDKTSVTAENEQMCFIYQDGLFNTGINKFTFNTRDLAKVPSFTF